MCLTGAWSLKALRGPLLGSPWGSTFARPHGLGGYGAKEGVVN